MLKRVFYWSSRAWYHLKGQPEQIIMSEYSDTEELIGAEIIMEWHELGNNYVPLLRMFDDAWINIPDFQDMFEVMVGLANQNVDPKTFVEILLELGFEDHTPYERPENEKTIARRMRLLEQKADLEQKLAKVKEQLGE